MKITLKLFLLLLLMGGCWQEPSHQKPFIIIHKSKYIGGDYITYSYQDKSGYIVEFIDTKDYQIGDTLK